MESFINPKSFRLVSDGFKMEQNLVDEALR
jgi:hypothetical protein